MSSRCTKNTNQPQWVENAPDMLLETEQRAQGKVGEHTKDKGWGVQGTPTIFFFFITCTNFCFFQTGSPSTEHQIHTRSGMFWCSAASPTFWTCSRCPHGRLLCVFLTKRDRLTFFGISVAFGCLLPHTSPFPHLSPFRHTQQPCWFRHVRCVFLCPLQADTTCSEGRCFARQYESFLKLFWVQLS